MAQQAVTVVALELMRQRAMRDTERRLAGDVLARRRRSPDGSRRRSWRCGCARSGSATAPRCSSSAATTARRSRTPRESSTVSWRRRHRRARCGPRASGCCAPWWTPARASTPWRSRVARGKRSRSRWAATLRAAASRAAPVGSLRRTFHEARCALEALALANGSSPTVASYPGPRGVPAPPVASGRRRAAPLLRQRVLGPLEDASGEYGDELIRSLEAYIEQNGQWEKAARELFCHRHTLRYRIRRVEQLTGRDLSSARDRMAPCAGSRCEPTRGS